MIRRIVLSGAMAGAMLSAILFGLSFFATTGANYLRPHGGPWLYLHPGGFYFSLLQTYPYVVNEQGFHAGFQWLKAPVKSDQIIWIPKASKSSQGTIDIAIPLWILCVAFGALGWFVWRLRRPIDVNRCPKCDHDISGILSARCPECGSPINNPPTCASSTSPHA